MVNGVLSKAGEQILCPNEAPVLLDHIVGRVHVLPDLRSKQGALLRGDPSHEGHHLLLLVVQDGDWVGRHERLVGVVVNDHPHPVAHIFMSLMLSPMISSTDKLKRQLWAISSGTSSA